MSTRPATKHSRTLLARTALSVLSAALVLGTSASLLAQDQPWPKYPPRQPPAAQPKPPARPKPAPPSKKAPSKQAPSKQAPSKQAPSKQAPAEPAPTEQAPAEPAPAKPAPTPPADEAPPPTDEAATPQPGADAPAPAEAAPAPPAEPVGADPVTPADESTETAGEPTEGVPAAADPECEACPPVAAPARPRPPARPAMPPVPPLATGPDELEWVEGAAIPPGYEPDTRVRKGLLIGGLVTFGVAWLGSAAAASYFIEQDRHGDRTFQVGDDSGEEYPAAAPLYVPVIGPFVAIGTMDPDKRITAALVADGVVQIGGVAMALAGLIAQEQVLVRSDTASVTVVPTVASQGAGGVSLLGSF